MVRPAAHVSTPKEENMDPLAYQFSQYVSDGVEGFIPYTDQPTTMRKKLPSMFASRSMKMH